MGIRCKRPKLELEHDGPDYDEGKKQVQNYKQIASALLKKESDAVVFEDETIVTQKPCIRKSVNEF